MATNSGQGGGRDTDRREPYADTVARKIIEQLEQGTAPWQKPWKPGELQLPFNPVTEAPYRGINSLYLMMQGKSDPRWMTYKQAASIGAQVRKGESSTVIQYWKFTGEEPVTDESGRPLVGADGKPQMQRVEYERPRVFHANVFNASQIDGLPPLSARPTAREWERQERAEAILAGSGVPIRYLEGDHAYYEVGRDQITMPALVQFDTYDAYYAVALHELGHATGHASRLNRDLSHPFGSEGYAKEELRAEIASLMLGERLDIGHDPGQHVAYVESWIKALRDDPREIFKAAAEAEKIAAHVMAYENTYRLSQAQESKLWRPAELIAQADRARATDWRADAAGLFIIEALKDGHPDRAIAHTTLPDTDASAQPPVLVELRSAIASEWARWQTANGLGPSITPAQQRGFEAIPRNLNELVPGLAVADPEQKLPVQRSATPEQVAMKAADRIDLVVSFKQKDQAKAAGARWDKETKTWYAPAGADLEKLAAWLPENQAVASGPKLSPQEEFRFALIAAGFDKSVEPIMDGKLHRAPLQGDNAKPDSNGEYRYGRRNGAYVGYLDGHPAGYIENFRSGERINWKSQQTTDSATAVDRERLNREAAARRAERDRERDAAHARTAEAVASLLAIAPDAPGNHPYLLKKGFATDAGESIGIKMVPQRLARDVARGLDADSPIKIGRTITESNALRKQHPDAIVFTAGDLLVPVHDIDGKVMSVQSIGATGQKGFATGGKIEGGHFTIAAANPGLGDTSAIIITEGYATAKTIADATGAMTVCAFNAGNIESVARAIREKHPDRSIVIAGDNDHHRPLEIDPRTQTAKRNIGKEAATAAAAAVNGFAAVPVFYATSPGTDWNDFARENGEEALKKSMAESMLLADRRQLEDAHRLGHDGERVDLNIRLHQANAEDAPDAPEGTALVTNMKSAYASLRNSADREADRQDTPNVAPELTQDTPAVDAEPPLKQVAKRGGRSRSRS